MQSKNLQYISPQDLILEQDLQIDEVPHPQISNAQSLPVVSSPDDPHSSKQIFISLLNTYKPLTIEAAHIEATHQTLKHNKDEVIKAIKEQIKELEKNEKNTHKNKEEISTKFAMHLATQANSQDNFKNAENTLTNKLKSIKSEKQNLKQLKQNIESHYNIYKKENKTQQETFKQLIKDYAEKTLKDKLKQNLKSNNELEAQNKDSVIDHTVKSLYPEYQKDFQKFQEEYIQSLNTDYQNIQKNLIAAIEKNKKITEFGYNIKDSVLRHNTAVLGSSFNNMISDANDIKLSWDSGCLKFKIKDRITENLQHQKLLEAMNTQLANNWTVNDTETIQNEINNIIEGREDNDGNTKFLNSVKDWIDELVNKCMASFNMKHNGINNIGDFKHNTIREAYVVTNSIINKKTSFIAQVKAERQSEIKYLNKQI